MSSAATIEYAPGAPVCRRKRNRRIAFLIILIAISLAAWRFGPAVRNHITLLYWQRQCMNYQIAPSTLLYEPDSTKAAALLNQPNPDYLPMLFYPTSRSPITQALYHPRLLREFETRTPGAFSTKDTAIIYLHERRTPSGKSRLVVVFTNPWSDFGPLWEWALYDPATIRKPKLLNSGQDTTYLRTGAMSGFYIPKRLGPAQTDPAEPTHFTIPSLVGGHPSNSFDAHLTDDDKIIITQQTAPKP